MQEILKHLNYQLSTASNAKKVTLIVVNNSDGSPRWICNSATSKPFFLKFYAISSFRSKIFAKLFELAFKLNLKGFLTKKVEVSVEILDENKSLIVDLEKSNWALFTGTVGPNNKMLVYSIQNDKSSFYKIGTTPQSTKIIENEKNTLLKIQNLNPTSFIVPKIIREASNFIEIEDVSVDVPRSANLNQKHINFLTEIYTNSKQKVTISELVESFQLETDLAELESKKDCRIPNGIIRKLRWLFKSIDNQEVVLSIGHGDFTPWNMYENGEKLSVYDWELSKDNFPVGFDAFHFIFQKGILIDRKNWGEIQKEIQTSISEDTFSKWSEDTLNQEFYLKLYTLLNSIHYLKIYSEQKEWHAQIYWLINTWNDALSDLIKDEKCHRELLIIDLFDFLNSKKYAAIKFHHEAPEELSELSDIDLCIEKKDLKEIHSFISQHPLVLANNFIHKSFMDALQIILKNGKVLSLDLIWKFKRKEVVFMDAEKVLEANYPNNYQVKLMSPKDLAIYVGLFYGLNKSEIPEKYLYLKENLKNKDSKLEEILVQNYLDNILLKNELNAIIKSYNENKSFNFFKNKIAYIVDSIKQMKSKKGLIITFSGVDGAGKSTIIENIKQELEKKLRKRVVVVRHRPSLLPILSAWTKGKKQAETDAANRLPRQGENKSSVSSLIRFLYYYSDYLFGQFYINFKYKYRGIIVLYDRYYFDFIIDGKRSNIGLNENLVKNGYRLILKPDCNFFLYADPEVILKRKQELSAETILELTEKYSTLFKELESYSNDKTTRYHLINNIDLEKTKSEIMTQIQAKLS